MATNINTVDKDTNFPTLLEVWNSLQMPADKQTRSITISESKNIGNQNILHAEVQY